MGVWGEPPNTRAFQGKRLSGASAGTLPGGAGGRETKNKKSSDVMNYGTISIGSKKKGNKPSMNIGGSK